LGCSKNNQDAQYVVADAQEWPRRRAVIGWAASPDPVARRVLRAIAAAVLLTLPHASAMAQKCNPVIDGTYCAEQMPRADTRSMERSTLRPIQDIAGAMSPNRDPIGTLGGISFGSGMTCMGLLRRGSCN